MNPIATVSCSACQARARTNPDMSVRCAFPGPAKSFDADNHNCATLVSFHKLFSGDLCFGMSHRDFGELQMGTLEASDVDVDGLVVGHALVTTWNTASRNTAILTVIRAENKERPALESEVLALGRAYLRKLADTAQGIWPAPTNAKLARVLRQSSLCPEVTDISHLQTYPAPVRQL